MLKKVRRFLKNNSPDWLNTEVNKDLLQNLSTAFGEAASTAIAPTQTTITSTSYDDNCSPLPKLGEGLGVRAEIQPASQQLKSSNSERQFSTTNSSPFHTPRTPHWRRIKQVFMTLDNAPETATYNQLIEYVRETTGVGCSRKLISKWKKQKLSQNSQVTSHKFPDYTCGDRHLKESTAAIAVAPQVLWTQLAEGISFVEPTISDTHSTACQEMGVNSFQLNEPADNSSINDSLNRPNLLPVKAWSYLTAAGITIALFGCELLPFNNNRLTENIAIASVTAPITPLTPVPERRKNRLEPRNIKIELTLSNPTDLKVKPGDKISAGQVLSDRISERNRLQARKKQLQLSLLKLNLPLTPVPQPKPIPEISPLPPVSYAEEEAAIKLKQQKLSEAERAIALQKEKIEQLRILLESNAGGQGCLGAGEKINQNSSASDPPLLLCFKKPAHPRTRTSQPKKPRSCQTISTNPARSAREQTHHC